ncbi:hypothetical protein D9756_003930 [Leucocoprinus leucothites]|uniref:Protein kinase domain-containing protein n=1 Tax=Leucocoprinus leucothites TaxID=201217 RepID=A0A8H5D9I3_9AGAR|nr:hypothetical protein D9756_003930 [Leucoagaricus leucothites]
MDMIYRPLLPPTQYCPCKWTTTELKSLPHSHSSLPFYRALFAPYSPLWVNPNPQTKDNSPSVKPEEAPHAAEIDYRVAFERQKRTEAKYWDSTAYFASLYIPKGRWQWTHQVVFENRPEEVQISNNHQYSLTVKTAKIYQETITYISKLWPRENKWDGFAREVALHKTQLRAIHGVAVPALIGVHTNFDGIQMTYDVPHHSFWIQASPDMPDVLKRRCLQAYDQLHCQGVLHGNVEFENILIGGDGRVKIINFERSRSSKPKTDVKLEAADRIDFKMEMREVHYKLDYMGARQKERVTWESRHNLQEIRFPAGNTSRIHSRYPYSISRESPADPTRWSLPRLWKPRRFVVPGQSAERFHHHLKQFLLGVAEEAGEGMNPPTFLGPTSQNPKKRKRNDSDSDNSELKAPKRARHGPLLEEKGRKVRFEQETDYSDGTTRIKRKLAPSPPPGQRRIVPRIPRELREANGLGASGYAPNVPPDNHCPHIPPTFDRRRFLWWESSRTSGPRPQDARPVGENDSGDSDQLSGKRRQESDDENLPRAKRLRRTETMFSESNDSGTEPPSTSSSVQDTPLVSPRYSLRSSSRRTQSSSTRLSRSSVHRTNTLASLPSSSRRQTQALAKNPTSRSLTPASSGPAASSHGSTSAATAGTQAHFTANQLTSATAMIVGSHTGIMPTEFGPIQVITYDQLASYRPIESRSAVETVRLVAEQLPKTLITTANRLARSFTFGLW